MRVIGRREEREDWIKDEEINSDNPKVLSLREITIKVDKKENKEV